MKEFNIFGKCAFFAVDYDREILEHWKKCSNPTDRALVDMVFWGIGGEK